MPDVQFWWGPAVYQGQPTFHATASAQETVTSSASAVNTTAVAPEPDEFCRVVVEGTGTVYVAVGVNAVASATNGMMIPAPGVVDFGSVPKGSRGSVINK